MKIELKSTVSGMKEGYYCISYSTEDPTVILAPQMIEIVLSKIKCSHSFMMGERE